MILFVFGIFLGVGACSACVLKVDSYQDPKRRAMARCMHEKASGPLITEWQARRQCQYEWAMRERN